MKEEERIEEKREYSRRRRAPCSPQPSLPPEEPEESRLSPRWHPWELRSVQGEEDRTTPRLPRWPWAPPQTFEYQIPTRNFQIQKLHKTSSRDENRGREIKESVRGWRRQETGNLYCCRKSPAFMVGEAPQSPCATCPMETMEWNSIIIVEVLVDNTRIPGISYSPGPGPHPEFSWYSFFFPFSSIKIKK